MRCKAEAVGEVGGSPGQVQSGRAGIESNPAYLAMATQRLLDLMDKPELGLG